MDWHLTYRSHADMQALAATLPAADVARCKVFADDHATITFLQVSKAE
jgi:hypothetical protein